MAPPVARQNLPTSNLVPNDYNPNVMDDEARNRLQEFIRQVKRVPSDIWVRCVDQVGADHTKHKHEIIDGFNRWDIARRLDLRSVPCEIYQVSDVAAMSMCYQINKVRGAPTPFREAAFFYLVLKRLPANRRTPHEIALTLNQEDHYVESRLLLWTVAPVAKSLGSESALPIAIWEELAKSVRVETDLTYVEQAVKIILPNAKDYMPGNVRNLIASLRRQEQRDQDVLKEAVTKAGKTEETLVDKTPPKARQQAPPPPPVRGKEPARKGGDQKPQSPQPHHTTAAAPEPRKAEEPKPAMLLGSQCYMCGAEDEIAIWTRDGTDRSIVKVVNRAKLKSFEKNLVQERSSSVAAVAEVKKERVLVSRQ